jgi:hypothetical protein
MFPWSTFVAGAVGVAGIIGTILAARMAKQSQTANLLTNIHAENERERQRVRRDIYVRHLAACQDAMGLGGDDVAAAGERSLANKAFGALRLVELVASKAVVDLATDLTLSATEGESSFDDFMLTQDRLIEAMRADLGETERTSSS